MNGTVGLLKRFLPDREMNLKIVRGPFRGGLFHSRPRFSLRKILGLYEYELNSWLESVLPQIDQVLDVGANDGYFTFGCAAAMQRLGKPIRIVAFEPVTYHVRQLERARDENNLTEKSVTIVQARVGRATGPKTVILDQFSTDGNASMRTLVKIDVEGEELDVVAGGMTWLNAANFFLIEVHSAQALLKLRKEFASAGRRLLQIDQKPLPLFGREVRNSSNWWLVSE